MTLGTIGLNLPPKDQGAVDASNNFSAYWQSEDPSSVGLQSLKSADEPYTGFAIDAGQSGYYLSLLDPC